MANINLNNSNYVNFYIQSDIFGKVKMDKEPGGWQDDYLELNRSEEHGIFVNFTNKLEFYKKFRDIIEDTFQALGNNNSLYLIKEELLDIDGDIKFVEIYRGRADWETKVIKNGVLEIRFNSDDIEEKLKANEEDEFEIEVLKSIDNVSIGQFETFKTSLLGRALISSGISKSIEPLIFKQMQNGLSSSFYTKTEIIAQGPFRHASVDINSLGEFTDYASAMFFVDSIEEGNDIELNIKIELDYESYYILNNSTNNNVFPDLSTLHHVCNVVKLKRNPSAPGGYDQVDGENIFAIPVSISKNQSNPERITLTSFLTINLEWDEGLILSNFYGLQSENGLSYAGLHPSNGPIYGRSYIKVLKQQISLSETSFEEPSIDLDCTFVHDVYSRLTAIINNNKDLFYSKYFGRTELGYTQDGEAGLVGLMSGYWIRAFDKLSEKYKSPKFSWDKLLKSTNAVFNVGMGVHLIDNIKKIRVEEVKFFYQNEVVVELGQVSNVVRKYDKSLYHSGLEFGYKEGGNYENEAGLDEPNIKSDFVTPDRKSKNKYQKISDIRSDETEMEILRRKPQVLFPEEDTGSDDHNWFVDLKRAFAGKFQQVSWQDRLQEIPSGVNEPETYRSFFFTPLRMLFRHGWIIRAGLESMLQKTIKQISSASNSNLTTHYINEEQSYSENLPNSLPVNKLERSRILPELIDFEYKLDRDTLNKLYGYTRIFYKGSYELIPNYYFKMSWINEKQETEYGYLMKMKPENFAKFTMQKSNEKPI